MERPLDEWPEKLLEARLKHLTNYKKNLQEAILAHPNDSDLMAAFPGKLELPKKISSEDSKRIYDVLLSAVDEEIVGMQQALAKRKGEY